MIPNIAPRGTRVGGLLRYLYGAGKREEHVNPHLVTAWDGARPLSVLEPAIGVGGKRDVRNLATLLQQPVRAGRNPPANPVWHCSLRLHPTDRVLTDQQWAHIAQEIMAATGLAPYGDGRAVRWVAVRHGADHIHLVATLVRQDRRTVWGRNDRWRVQAACRDLEERYGLYRVGPTDRTAHKRPHHIEVHKARRIGQREPARNRLRREVRYAAAVSASAQEFFALLAAAGVQVRLRHSTVNPEQITGYAVAVDGHTTAAGRPVWYGGGRLAPDLTLPQLRTRWCAVDADGPVTTPEGDARRWEQAAAWVRAATDDIRRLRHTDPAAASAAA
ncbi:MAG: relaxase, partial [Dactylosporangium sp.]|nr:relaxase/mobilization nuclease domain-containing protein [Dactylosporangium sp.]NNJ63495.1 relaxase [Dactylosporangium sp.]